MKVALQLRGGLEARGRGGGGILSACDCKRRPFIVFVALRLTLAFCHVRVPLRAHVHSLQSLTSNNLGVGWSSEAPSVGCLWFSSLLVSNRWERDLLSAVLFLVPPHQKKTKTKTWHLFNILPHEAQTHHDEKSCLGVVGSAVSAWHWKLGDAKKRMR